jgi:hypothetical protein
LAQAIVDASKKEGFEPHKTEAFKSIMGKGATAKCLVCEDETIYVGKLDFIQETSNHRQRSRKNCRATFSTRQNKCSSKFWQWSCRNYWIDGRNKTRQCSSVKRNRS